MLVSKKYIVTISLLFLLLGIKGTAFCQESTTYSKGILVGFNQGNYSFLELGFGRHSVEHRHGNSGLVYGAIEAKLAKTLFMVPSSV